MPTERALAYIALWGGACLVAIVLGVLRGRRFAIASRDYWRGLVRPWKLFTFAVAFAGIVLVAPRSGDPTWDHVDAAFMAILTYLTAPWTLGVVVRALKKQLQDRAEIYVAACTWLFSASFSYDLYIFLRDHHYPSSWWANIIASSGLYAAGGAMWSLRWERGAGTSFAFLRDPWPATLGDGETRGLWPFVLLFMGVVLALLAPFLWMAVNRR